MSPCTLGELTQFSDVSERGRCAFVAASMMQWSKTFRASKARPFASASEARASEARTGPLWQQVAGVIRRCADIMPRIARNAGAISMTAPFFHDIPGFHYSSARYCSALCRCLQFRLRAMPRARSPVRVFFFFFFCYALPLLRCHTVITLCV